MYVYKIFATNIIYIYINELKKWKSFIWCVKKMAVKMANYYGWKAKLRCYTGESSIYLLASCFTGIVLPIVLNFVGVECCIYYVWDWYWQRNPNFQFSTLLLEWQWVVVSLSLPPAYPCQFWLFIFIVNISCCCWWWWWSWLDARN